LPHPSGPLLKELTTRDEVKWLTVDDPVDVSGKRLCTDLTIQLQNDDGDDVKTPTIIIKLTPFEFISYKARTARKVTPWLKDYAQKRSFTVVK
jgi:hypothetical protein